jgi:Flp pilus assembly protein TadB
MHQATAATLSHGTPLPAVGSLDVLVTLLIQDWRRRRDFALKRWANAHGEAAPRREHVDALRGVFALRLLAVAPLALLWLGATWSAIAALLQTG